MNMFGLIITIWDCYITKCMNTLKFWLSFFFFCFVCEKNMIGGEGGEGGKYFVSIWKPFQYKKVKLQNYKTKCVKIIY